LHQAAAARQITKVRAYSVRLSSVIAIVVSGSPSKKKYVVIPVPTAMTKAPNPRSRQLLRIVRAEVSAEHCTYGKTPTVNPHPERRQGEYAKLQYPPVAGKMLA
jgi:hypothetical protein